MNEESLDLIEMDGKEYVIVQRISTNEKNYVLLNEVFQDELLDNTLVLEEQDGFLCSIEDEEEKKALTKYILDETKGAVE